MPTTGKNEPLVAPVVVVAVIVEKVAVIPIRVSSSVAIADIVASTVALFDIDIIEEFSSDSACFN